jgi:membrane-bound transcription factor site-1 protease
VSNDRRSILRCRCLKMLGETGEANRRYNVLVLGLLQTRSTDKSGRIIIYGDSNCIDASHLEAACYWMLDAMLEYTSTSHLPSVFKDNQLKNWEHTVDTDVPVRMEGNRLYRYSKFWRGIWGSPRRDRCLSVPIWCGRTLFR